MASDCPAAWTNSGSWDTPPHTQLCVSTQSYCLGKVLFWHFLALAAYFPRLGTETRAGSLVVCPLPPGVWAVSCPHDPPGARLEKERRARPSAHGPLGLPSSPISETPGLDVAIPLSPEPCYCPHSISSNSLATPATLRASFWSRDPHPHMPPPTHTLFHHPQASPAHSGQFCFQNVLPSDSLFLSPQRCPALTSGRLSRNTTSRVPQAGLLGSYLGLHSRSPRCH